MGPKLTYPNLVATACLFVVLGGSSVAAPVRDAASKLITGKQVRDGSLSERDLSSSARVKLRGQAGAPGADGKGGADGTSVTSSSLPTHNADCLHGGSSFISASGTTYACNGAKGDTGLQGPAGLVSDTFFEGDGADNQPSGEKGEILRATGLPAGTYLVSYWTYVIDPQRYECGVAGGSADGPVSTFTYRTASGGDAETIDGTGIVTVGANEDQVFYCRGFTANWSASNPRLDFMKIDSVSAG